MIESVYKLKPCPFCGGEAKEYDRFNANTVTCTQCNVKIRQSEMGYGDASERWNERADDSALLSALKHTEFLLAQVRKENDHLKHLLNPDNISGRTSFKPTHVDDWLDNECAHTDSERYARFVINYFRMPALEQFDFAQWMEPFKLFCTYKGKRYRVTGASRLGDIWLAANPEQTTGYDLRVSVRDCDQWADSPTEGAE